MGGEKSTGKADICWPGLATAAERLFGLDKQRGRNMWGVIALRYGALEESRKHLKRHGDGGGKTPES